MKLLVVESPAKAKTIKGYLDNEFEVLASIGHFRDLPEKGMGIEENEEFSVKKWEIDNKKIDPIIKIIKKSDEIFLALDPDREGELIAWHLLEICKEKGLQEINSSYNVSNNGVIIPKLKADFHITSMEIFDVSGVLTILSYYTNLLRTEILDFRTVQKKPSKKVKEIFSIWI